jgi:hypothetical protein
MTFVSAWELLITCGFSDLTRKMIGCAASEREKGGMKLWKQVVDCLVASEFMRFYSVQKWLAGFFF